jgi:hypothetical protein
MKINANETFEKAFNGEPNFVTPDVVERSTLMTVKKQGKPATIVYEISKGSIFTVKPVYGVTLLLVTHEDRRIIKMTDAEVNKAVESLQDARNYLAQIKRGAVKVPGVELYI